MGTKRTAADVAITTALILVLTGCGTQPGSVIGSAPQSVELGDATCQKDFTFTLSPQQATITSGQTVRLAIDLSSICQFAGTVDAGIQNISPEPTGSNGFTFVQSRYDIPLVANGSAGAYITFGATPATLKTTYTITIQSKAVSGCCRGLQHAAIFALTVK
ncbi:MAG TPA: hypothetical protein VGK84_13230 [Candidatus Tumulicola sp.]|jgi:hypothetical protein